MGLHKKDDHIRLRWDRGDKRQKKRPPLQKRKARFDLSKSLGGLRQPPSIPPIPPHGFTPLSFYNLKAELCFNLKHNSSWYVFSVYSKKLFVLI